MEIVMTTYSLWNDDEISNLKNQYLSGVPIKIIAKQMNRTPTSINKALSRFGIRKSKEKKASRSAITTYKEMVNVCQNHLPKKTYLATVYNQEEWVTLEQVVGYLKKIGINIQKVFHDGLNELYYNNKLLSPLQAILLANRHRCQHNLSCFKVGDITW